jgi:hypothetical protein
MKFTEKEKRIIAELEENTQQLTIFLKSRNMVIPNGSGVYPMVTAWSTTQQKTFESLCKKDVLAQIHFGHLPSYTWKDRSKTR